jgi:hypothetical protein
MHPQSAGPGFVGPATTLIVSKKYQIGQCVGSNKLMFARGELRLLMDSPPSAGIKVRLMQYIAIGIACIEG